MEVGLGAEGGQRRRVVGGGGVKEGCGEEEE